MTEFLRQRTKLIKATLHCQTFFNQDYVHNEREILAHTFIECDQKCVVFPILKK